MNCLKCGREIPDGSVFCSGCLEDMKKYPVKPGTPIQLPLHTSAPPVKKKTARDTVFDKPEDAVRHLRSANRWLTVALVAAVVAFALTAALLLHTMDQMRDSAKIGQNYQVVSNP